MIDSKYAWQGQANGDKETIQVVADATGLPAELAALLVNQGIKSADAAQRWLNPQAEDLHTPDALHDVDRAVERIMAAVEAGEKITVYGDYDADGITATTLMYEALETLGAQVDYYVPDRFTDGYGPNQAVYQRLIEGAPS
ncbi:DHH family phosphoesterase [Limosilactobacillus fermentum]|nr:DHH family phosphoesterase [Limosilactobacillus fermentum]